MTPEEYNVVWERGNYRGGSTCQRLIPFLKRFILEGSVVNDYGSGTGRAEKSLLEFCSQVNMVDFASVALEQEALLLVDGVRLTYTISPLENLPAEFPIASWGICINVLMTVDPTKLYKIMSEMRRTCKDLIIEVYDLPDMRLGKDMTTIKGNTEFWATQMKQHWPIVESYPSPEHPRRYITVGRS
jgi:hypothetical protein